MQRLARRTITGRRLMLGAVTLLVVGLGVVVIVGIGEPVRQAPSASVLPAPLAAGDPITPPRPTPKLQLISEDGRATSLAAFRGKWLIFAPAMTLCHEECPMTTGALMSLSSMLRKDGLASQVKVAEVTVDPWRDSPARLRAYKKMTGLNFELFTGTLPEIRRFWHFFGVYFQRVPAPKPAPLDWWTHKPVTMEVEHGDGLFFLDPAGNERIAVEGEANVHGHLPNAFLRSQLDKEGHEILAHPRLPWSASQAMEDLDWLTGREIPASEVRQAKAPSAAIASRELAGSPRQLASLHAQAGQLLGSTGLDARLKALRGYPVVLNAWASWCPPCQAEFPLFATASATYGRRVAFIGVDTEDEPLAAKAFLGHHPVSYPSYQSSSQGLAALANVANLPTTIYLGPEGKVRYVHAGQYETAEVLDSDIARYALGE